MSNAWIIFALLTVAGTAMVGLYAWRRNRAHKKLLADNDARAAGRVDRSRRITPPVPMRTFGVAHPQSHQPRMPARPGPLPQQPPLPNDDKERTPAPPLPPLDDDDDKET